ncbi:hypothetical protein V494_04529 [Pseudogymnoascus sp. VKM F-4513 (FW-928)]|nr:hypothetical protein V494_04529 [Pseudogymnoascus sp. VKM F-4513 (FW-928)]
MPATPPASLQAYNTRHPATRGTRLSNVTPSTGTRTPGQDPRTRHQDSPSVNHIANGQDEQANDDSEDNEGIEEQDNGSEEGDEESVEEEEDGVESVDSRVEDDDGEMAIDAPPVATHNGMPVEVDSVFDPTGLKEIGNLASWTVSTCKPGSGVEALRDDDTSLYWQSDGPQPHHLNIHFSRLVSILSIRIFLDFEADESYTPTRITLLAGTGYHDLIPFSSLEFTQPKGWINVPLDGVGGGPDGNTLRAFLVQVKVVENHQNGKDTHVRGLRIYARDEKTGRNLASLEDWGVREKKGAATKPLVDRTATLAEPEWMEEMELR